MDNKKYSPEEIEEFNFQILLKEKPEYIIDNDLYDVYMENENNYIEQARKYIDEYFEKHDYSIIIVDDFEFKREELLNFLEKINEEDFQTLLICFCIIQFLYLKVC